MIHNKRPVFDEGASHDDGFAMEGRIDSLIQNSKCKPYYLSSQKNIQSKSVFTLEYFDFSVYYAAF
tara:strand:+ start:342 stop:539 length:198 start_codon:yes stop_codon:yes gene_type:complete